MTQPPLTEARIPDRSFAEMRRLNLARWPTGAEVDLDEAVAYLQSVPEHKKLAWVTRRAVQQGHCLTQPRGGFGTFAMHEHLLETLDRQGLEALQLDPAWQRLRPRGKDAHRQARERDQHSPCTSTRARICAAPERPKHEDQQRHGEGRGAVRGPDDAAVRAQVEAARDVVEVLHHPAVAARDALGSPRGAGRIDDIGGGVVRSRGNRELGPTGVELGELVKLVDEQ